MATFEEGFLYPLILLLVGAGLTGALIPWFTKRWEERRKERELEAEKRRKGLEIKVDIASKMAEVIGSIIGEATVSTWKKKHTLTLVDEDALYEKLNKWYVDDNIIRSKLESYFSGLGIKEKWVVYSIVLNSFYVASTRYFLKDKENTDLEHHLHQIREYFAHIEEVEWHRLRSDKPFDSKLWFRVSQLMMERGDEIIKDVLTFPIKVL